MMSNRKLINSQKAKNDEFYTRLSYIEKELKFYDFNGKIVYSNCDDYRKSSFTKYFRDNFEKLGLKKYVCTNYNNGDGAFKYEYDGKNETITRLEGDGGFDSNECIEILKTVDVVVSNPPFSKLNIYFSLLTKYPKQFLIIVPHSSIGLKNIFSQFFTKHNIWLGHVRRPAGIRFNVPANQSYSGIDEEGKYKQINTCWLTNYGHPYYPEKIELKKKYSPQEFPHYDDYDAINVDKCADIPMDWDGVMGVPLTFFLKYCPEQFEIVSNKPLRQTINGKTKFIRVPIKLKNTCTKK